MDPTKLWQGFLQNLLSAAVAPSSQVGRNQRKRCSSVVKRRWGPADRLWPPNSFATCSDLCFPRLLSPLISSSVNYAENAVPGAYSQVCMTLPERTVKLKSTGETLSILQGATSGNDSRGTVSGRTGVAVWNSGLLLLRVLDAVTAADPSFLAGRKALELGCGAGLISVALAKMGASEVMATDGNPEVVGLARENAERNGAAGTVRAAELRWGMLDAADYYDYADVVVGSDLTYNSGTWRVLAETLGAVLKPEGAAIYLALGHSGFNVAGEMAGFLSVVESEGLELVEEGSERWPFDKNVKSLSKFLEQCTSPEEKAVINGTGGARVIVLRKKPFKKM
mmetsp:Transcript_27673/g.56721  ORF Transcript_27673/g.56721 Transcript_27673/m.56721 type:complete len:338 (-) Transcript_27673:140-1153(-)